MGKGTIVFHGDRGTGKSPHTSKCVVNGVTDKTALVTLSTALSGFTSCNRGRAGFVDFDAGTPSAPGASVNVDERAVIYCKDTVDDSLVSITIPGWDTVAHPLDSASSEGDRIAAADVAAVAAALAAATGKTLVGLWGKHIKRS